MSLVPEPKERTPDVLDQASELTSRLTQAALDRTQAQAKPQQVQRADGTWPHEQCVECGEDIPLPRLRLGRIRCIHCQQDLERGVR